VALAMLASMAALGCEASPTPRETSFPPTRPQEPPVHVDDRPLPASPASPALPPLPLQLRLTEGTAVPDGARVHVTEPATRGYLEHSTGDDAELEIEYLGPTAQLSTLASGDSREQVGLKLRAQDSCNVIYVMWRLDQDSGAKREITVQLKRNTDAHTHEECGNAGYTRVRPTFRAKPPILRVERRSAEDTTHYAHTLRAAITSSSESREQLEVYADGALVWRGTLPAEARQLRGPAGFRTDNVDVVLTLRGQRVDHEVIATQRLEDRD
jgi:hypothetical protein